MNLFGASNITTLYGCAVTCYATDLSISMSTASRQYAVYMPATNSYFFPKLFIVTISAHKNKMDCMLLDGEDEIIALVSRTLITSLLIGHTASKPNRRCIACMAALQAAKTRQVWCPQLPYAQWRRNRGFRRFNEPGPLSSWGSRVMGPQKNLAKKTIGLHLKTNNKLQSAKTL